MQLKIFGCTLGIAGVVLCVASVAIFGTELFRAGKKHEVITIPLQVGVNASTPEITVDTTNRCMISVRGTVRSHYSQPETGKEHKYALKYSFPFRYSVDDSSGKALVSERSRFAWDGGTRSTANLTVTGEGGSSEIRHDFKTFKVSQPGQIRVEAQIDPDSKFRAEANDLTLIVYDNVTEHSKFVIAGLMLLALGGGLGFVGFVVFIMGLGKPSNKDVPQTQEESF